MTIIYWENSLKTVLRICSEDRRPTLKHFWLHALFPGLWPSCSFAQRHPLAITHTALIHAQVCTSSSFILFIPWFGRKIYLDLVTINIFAMIIWNNSIYIVLAKAVHTCPVSVHPYDALVSKSWWESVQFGFLVVLSGNTRISQNASSHICTLTSFLASFVPLISAHVATVPTGTWILSFCASMQALLSPTFIPFEGFKRVM